MLRLGCWSLSRLLSPRFASAAVSAAEAGRIHGASLGSSKPSASSAQVTSKDLKRMQCNRGLYLKNRDKPSYWHVLRNPTGLLFNPLDEFLLSIKSSKNNIWYTLMNKCNANRTLFTMNCGLVGINTAAAKTRDAAVRTAESVARKMKNLGILSCDVKFRYLPRIEACLETLVKNGISLKHVSYIPRLAVGIAQRPRKRRRV